ncbi:peptidase S9, prolyl oligopeptidase [Pseudohyphozyma bogoriensis]|nr:peptidase S9, prolyl oligopeptidase [Pseudohyphozyma bogoriensis]
MAPKPPATARVPFKEVEGHTIYLEVWLPQTVTHPVPAVVWVHGGGLFDGCSSDWSDLDALPLSRGWALVGLDYRLAPQVGLKEIVEDVKDGVRFVMNGGLDKALGGGKVDGERTAVSGCSAGGLLALLSSYQLSPAPRAVFAAYPVANPSHQSYNAPVAFPYHITYAEVAQHLDLDTPVVSHAPADVDFATMVAEKRTRACFYMVQEGGIAEKVVGSADPEELKKYVPKELVNAESTPPTAIVHGVDDMMVPVLLSEELWETLKEKKVDVLFVKVEGANHGFDLLEGATENARYVGAYNKANDFLAKYLQ